MTEMTATFDPQAVVDQLEEHRALINDGQFRQMIGDTEGALGYAIAALNLTMSTLLEVVLSEENRRDLRQLTADTHNVATRFQLEDDEEFLAAFDKAHAA